MMRAVLSHSHSSSTAPALCTIRKLLLVTEGRIGGPPKVRHRTPSPTSAVLSALVGALAAFAWGFAAGRAALFLAASGVRGGNWPFGGSTMREVRGFG